MPLSFNNAGPQRPGKHYTLDPLRRMNADEILRLIEAERYFVLHAPRQTGKTSCLLALRDKLNAEGKFRALYVNIEAAKAVAEEIVQEIMAGSLGSMIEETFPKVDALKMLAEAKATHPEEPFTRLIRLISQHDPARPLVLFIDEADTLSAKATVTYLSQLRAGYSSRPSHFPQSIILCGLKDIRDFRITDEDGKQLTSGSAFNILSKSLTLGNFSKEEVSELYSQHTAATGQAFTRGALDLVFELTWGQPWMVNKLGDLACFCMAPGKDRATTVTEEMIHAAREEMIRERAVHLDNLTFRLKEDRVRRVIAPMIQGNSIADQPADAEDIRYCLDLGIIRLADGKNPVIANPIYREIIPRELTAATQIQLQEETAWYREADGRMNIPKLLRAFQNFYRNHAESDRWFPHYSEAGAQLLLQAWLQRIINGGGQIEREYGLGTKRVDLLIRWPYPQPVQEMVIELKVIRHKDSPASVLAEGLQQIDHYMQRVAATEGHLILFDQRPGVDWETKFHENSAVTPAGRSITVWGG